MYDINNINNYFNNKITEKPVLFDGNILGKGSFGNVYIALDNNNNKIALKVEQIKDENGNKKTKQLTLLKEFKVCLKFYVISIKLKKILMYENLKNKNSKHLKNNKEYNKLSENIKKLDEDDNVKIYNYITEKNLLVVPKELDMNYMLTHNCIAQTYSFYSCEDYNFLTMKLYGKNLEYITDNYYLTEKAKYFLAYKLLHSMSCIHRCGIIHRDIKLANFVLNDDCDVSDKNKLKTLYPTIIDLGLSTNYYKYEDCSINHIPVKKTDKLTGTIRYISLNIHSHNSPTIIDDLISMCYSLIVICTNKSLPWMGHLKDDIQFDKTHHTDTNCKCNYHKNVAKNKTKHRNTIAEVKYHTPYDKLTGNYTFLAKWLKYLYSLKCKQMPSYDYLLKILKNDVENNTNLLHVENLHFDILRKKQKV